MRPYPTLDALLWFVPLVLVLVYIGRALRTNEKKIFQVFAALVMSVAFYFLFRHTTHSSFTKLGRVIYLVVGWLAILLMVFGMRTGKPRPKNAHFFIAHPDLLLFLIGLNGFITTLIFLGYLYPFESSIPLAIVYAMMYACYLLVPLYAVYGLCFLFLPRFTLRLVVWVESLRSFLLALNLGAYVFTKTHLPAAKSMAWLVQWQTYPGNNRNWTNRHFVTLCLMGLLLFFGLQLLMQWLCLFFQSFRKNYDIAVAEIFSKEKESTEGLFPWWCRILCVLMIMVCFGKAVHYLGTNPQVEIALFDKFPLLEKLHLPLGASESRNLKEKLRDRKKLFRYPLKKTSVPKAYRRPDLVFFVIRSWGSDAMQERHMPQFTKIVGRNRLLHSFRHTGGSSSGSTGLHSILYSLHPYRLDLVKKRRAWPLHILRKQGYRIVGLTRKKGELTKRMGFHQVIPISAEGEKGNQQIFRWLDRHLTHSSQMKKPLLKRLTTSRPASQKSTSLPQVLPIKLGRGKKSRPKVVVAVLDIMNARRRREYRACSSYRGGLKSLDAQLAHFWERHVDGRKTRNLAVVFAGESGWMQEGATPKGVDWLKNGSVPMILHYPGFSNNRALFSSDHTAIFPTLFELMGIKVPVSTYSDGTSLLRASSKTPVHVISEPLPATKGMALRSFPYSFFADWNQSLRIRSPYSLGHNGGLTYLSRERYRKEAVKFRASFDRFWPGLNFWNIRPIKVMRNKQRHLRRASPCAEFPLTERKLDYLPFVQYPSNGTSGGVIQFIGYDIENFTARKRDLVRVRVTIKVLQDLGPWRLYTHLLSGDWFKNKGREVFHKYPYKKWKAGDIVQGTLKFRYPLHRGLIISMGLWAPGKGRQSVYVGGRYVGGRFTLLRMYPSRP